MRRNEILPGRLLIAVLWVCSCWPRPVAAGPPDTNGAAVAGAAYSTGGDSRRSIRGIEVEAPKIYDDAFLAQLLQSDSDQLSQLKAFDNPSLISRIGAVQGGTLQQSSLSAQATVSTTKATKTTPLTPSVPSTTDTGAPALPASLSTSASSALAEQAQLASDIDSLRLLLSESFSDLYVNGGGLPKRTVTVGIPISLEPPPGAEGAVAEVEVSFTTWETETMSPPSGCVVPNAPEPPGVVALLPREEAYNVAAITDKSTSLGAGAVIANIINVGVGWFGRTQTSYIVQALDTVALQRPAPANCNSTTVLAWQFRPVLGQKAVKAGPREVFVRLAFDVRGTRKDLASVVIRTSWRQYHAASGIVGKEICKFRSAQGNPRVLMDSGRFANGSIQWNDLGNGQVTVVDTGVFPPGTSVLVPEGRLTAGSPGFSLDPRRLTFNLTALQLVRQPIGSLISSVGNQKELKVQDCAPQHPEAATRIVRAFAEAFDAAQSKVTVVLGDGDLAPATHAPLIRLGQSVYGLSNAPLQEDEVSIEDRLKKWQQVSFLAPTSDIRQYRRLDIAHPFCGPRFFDSHAIDFPNDFVATGATTLSSAGDTTVLGISGKLLTDQVAVLVNGVAAAGAPPAGASAPGLGTTRKVSRATHPRPLKNQQPPVCEGQPTIDRSYAPTLLLLNVPTCKMTGVKSLVVARPGGGAVALALDSADPKPQITAPAPLPLLAGTNTKRLLRLTGTNLGLVKDVQFNGSTMQPLIAADQSFIDVPLPDAINTVAGLHLLTALQNNAAHTPIPVVVQITAPPPTAGATPTGGGTN